MKNKNTDRKQKKYNKKGKRISLVKNIITLQFQTIPIMKKINIIAN